MADAVAQVATERRRQALSRRRRDDVWIASTALIASMLSLPLAPNSLHGPEMSAVLAVSATALLAGQRWAVAVVVLAELLLLPTVWPRAFLTSSDFFARIGALSALAALVPGVLAMRRAAAALVVVSGWRRTQQVCRRVHMGLLFTLVVTALLPVL